MGQNKGDQQDKGVGKNYSTSSSPSPIPHTIIVPQGAEYQAVRRGLSRVSSATPTLISIPVGIKASTTYLHKLQANGELSHHPQMKVLVMGLCGSLTPTHTVGDIVLYQDCVYQGKLQECDRTFTAEIYSHLHSPVLVRALTSDRVVCSAAEKRHLGQMFAADVVDMEGFAVLDFFHKLGVSVAMVRVVSDDCHHDIPDLTSVISADGSLKPLPLTLNLIRQPVAAWRLIRGSLRGLNQLSVISYQLSGITWGI